jgi:Cu/Ag efflux protein CusF
MSKRLFSIVILCAITATAAQAQYGGGGMGGGRGGGHGGRGGRSQPATSKPTASPTPAPVAPKPVSDIEIIGVIKAIDAAASRITIEYEPVEALRWPAGTMPFVVSKTALLNGATVGEKVRFKIDSEQISSLTPY